MRRLVSAGALLGLSLWLTSGAPQDQAKATIAAPSDGRPAAAPVAKPRPGSAETLLRLLARETPRPMREAEGAVAPERPRLQRTAAGSSTAPLDGAFDLQGRLEANLKRLAELPPHLPSTYVVVNIPQARLWMVRDGRVEGSMRVVVGRPEQPTPLMTAQLTHIVLNPHWYVPQDLLRSSLAPAAAKTNGQSLIDAGYEVMSSWRNDAQPVPPSQIDWRAVMAGRLKAPVRQKPGPGNMMGAAKFIMPNDQGIYLHDTPQTDLFAADQRTASAGCVRLEDYEQLMRFLLRGDQISDHPADRPTFVKLARPVPVFLTYVTALPTPHGVRLLDDPYGLDARRDDPVDDQLQLAELTP